MSLANLSLLLDERGTLIATLIDDLQHVNVRLASTGFADSDLQIMGVLGSVCTHGNPSHHLVADVVELAKDRVR